VTATEIMTYYNTLFVVIIAMKGRIRIYDRFYTRDK